VFDVDEAVAGVFAAGFAISAEVRPEQLLAAVADAVLDFLGMEREAGEERDGKAEEVHDVAGPVVAQSRAMCKKRAAGLSEDNPAAWEWLLKAQQSRLTWPAARSHQWWWARSWRSKACCRSRR